MNHIFDIPYFLLKEILSFNHGLETLDNICFSLTCRKYYNERDKYLIFDPKSVRDRDDGKLSFSAYQSIFQRTTELRKQLKLCVMSSSPNLVEQMNQYDYYPKDELEDKSELFINENVCELTYQGDMLRLEKAPNLARTNIKYLDVRVDSDGYFFEPEQLPPNLTHVALYFTLLDFPNRFGDGLTYLYLSWCVKPFPPGILPSTLKWLLLSTYDFKIEENTIPSQLLHYENNTIMYNWSLEHLPLTLETVAFDIENSQPAENVSSFLMNSTKLKRISNLRYDQLAYITGNPVLEFISFSSIDLEGQTISDLSTLLPASVTDLDFNYLYNYEINSQSIPQTIINLWLDGCKSEITPDVLPRNLKILYLGSESFFSYNPNLFPTTIERLSFGYDFGLKVTVDQLFEMISVIQKDSDVNHLEIDLPLTLIDEFQLNLLPPNIKCIQVESNTKLRRIDNEWFVYYDHQFHSGFINIKDIHKLNYIHYVFPG